MQYIYKSLPLASSAIPEDLSYLPGQHPLFLDIETTGLSSAKNQLYMIGCCAYAEESIEFHQWFAEKQEEEREILLAFAAFLPAYDTLVHFNGDTFDLPFLLQKAADLHVELDLASHVSFDLLKEARRLKKLLDLPNLKQKTLELFLGLSREDQMSGGELVEVYRRYRKAPAKEDAYLLQIHNEEDVLHLPDLLPLLRYRALILGDFSVSQLLHADDPITDRITSDSSITIDLQLDTCFPSRLFLRHDAGSLLLKNDRIHLSLLLRDCEMKYFFPDYKNYYYLPEEDIAMHKSVGEFVDKNHRCKASRETAFIRHTSRFLPFPCICKGKRWIEGTSMEGDWRFFREEYHMPAHLDLGAGLPTDTSFWKCYIEAFLNSLP